MTADADDKDITIVTSNINRPQYLISPTIVIITRIHARYNRVLSALFYRDGFTLPNSETEH